VPLLFDLATNSANGQFLEIAGTVSGRTHPGSCRVSDVSFRPVSPWFIMTQYLSIRRWIWWLRRCIILQMRGRHGCACACGGGVRLEFL
jgi:hypothetical protein